MHVVLKDQSYWIEHTTYQIYEVKEKQERFCTTHCWTHTRNDFFLRHAFLLPARHYLAPQNRNIRARGMETTIRHCLNLEHGRSTGRSCAFCMTGTVRPIGVLLLGGVSKLVIEVKKGRKSQMKISLSRSRLSAPALSQIKLFQPKDPPYSTELVWNTLRRVKITRARKGETRMN